MNLFSIRIVFDRKGETKSNPKKEALVQIEVIDKTAKRKKYITTRIKLFANQYSANGGFSVKNHPNAIILKSKVFEVYNKIEAFIHSDKCTCIDDIDNWNSSKTANMTFLDFVEQEMYKKPIKAGTLKTHKTLLLGLVRFGKIKHFKDITYPNIADFDVFLRQTLKSQPILYKRHNTLSSYINEAKRRKLLTENPYDEFRIKKGKSKDPVVLNELEIKKIIDYKPTSTKIEKVRDMYLFQCMTGLAFVDMQNFSKDKINYVDNEPIINASRVKTDESYIIPLFKEAKEILEKYDYCLPRISNQKYNDYIKVLAEHVGIDKKLTSHTARHSFATVLKRSGPNIAYISESLGHSDLKTTENYLASFEKEERRKNAKLLTNFDN